MDTRLGAIEQARAIAGYPWVKRYFQKVLQDGQPVIAAASIQHEGRIDMGESVPNWKAFTSNQRVITCRPGFDRAARVRMLTRLSAFIHDAYVAGRGRLQASGLGLFNTADMKDSPDLKRESRSFDLHHSARPE